MKKEKVIEPVKTKTETEKERLLELYNELKVLNVRSIGDLENLIANAE